MWVLLQNVKDYQGIIDAAKTSIKAKQLAAQLIPRFFKFFPDLSGPAIDTHLDLIEEEELGVSVMMFNLYSSLGKLSFVGVMLVFWSFCRFGYKRFGGFPYSARTHRSISPRLWTFLCNFSLPVSS